MGILQGLKILDFSTLLPGPYATMMLADMGAKVIRVESPSRTDLVREMKPMDSLGKSAAHGHLNRSKKSLALNLKSPEAVEIVKELIKEYDIVIEQFRPGVMKRFGLDYESLSQINPKLIYCSITGYGQTGPYKMRAGHDNNYLSVAGVVDYSRRKDELPAPAGIQIADIAGGSMHAVIGILAASYSRERSGKGQAIDISMTDTTFALNAFHGSGYLAGNREPEAEKHMLNGGSFYDFYETKDHRFFSVGSIEPQFRKSICEALGKEEWIHKALSEEEEDQIAFKNMLKDSFLEKDFDEWLKIFNQNLDACVEPVLTFAEACNHPQLKARKMIVDVPQSNGTPQPQIASPIKFSSGDPVYHHAGVDAGVHTEEILLGAGFTLEQIEDWKKTDVFN
ncbi:carnitine dehydratase [Sporosarcina sp. P34]|uniref:CaiB/BaiF CoA transferase family protein n=1 Tax=Sporosarcina sp. P34 TaxID=2048247 RepID=UPI000C16E33A|nr:CaiB/BaiF CoA-transferase family protein [Sporosarcina sp. P34]PID13868.1 carnitine dehydratase [Sporosarcina sp. P34]